MVKPAARREVVRHLRARLEYSEHRACRLIRTDRSSFRYRPRERGDDGVRQRLYQLPREPMPLPARALDAWAYGRGIRLHFIQSETEVEHGVDDIIVSNHGARQVDNSLSTIEVLPEIARAAGGRIPIMIDSGFRRGTDVFTALALGAAAVCVGRPYLWGLASFGQEGAEAVLTILRAELEVAMRHMGTRGLADISAATVKDLRESERDPNPG